MIFTLLFHFASKYCHNIFIPTVAADCGRQGTQMPPSQKCWGAKRSFCPPDFSSPYRLALATEQYSRTGAVSYLSYLSYAVPLSYQV